ncbi:amidohydrolase family protein, partial [Nonomuraea sp. NPDC059022]|uniref:amidohydrolase family protein n=1 Tax=Nonomuraea sp. NPDC059022 TaxID=3346705 RepID=UPI0036A4D1E5
MILDAHGHLGPWPDFLIPDKTADGMVELMDRLGIDAIGISHLLGVGPSAEEGNRLAFEAAGRYPGRIGVWQVYNPHQRNRLTTEGVWGVKIHPDVHQCRLDDRRYDPVWELGLGGGAPRARAPPGGGPGPVYTPARAPPPPPP